MPCGRLEGRKVARIFGFATLDLRVAILLQLTSITQCE
jgi:hypothetical protein